MAEFLGIDPVSEKSLLWVAEKALHEGLPDGWEEFRDEDGETYYYHAKSDVSQFDHPNDERFLEEVANERRRMSKPSDPALRMPLWPESEGDEQDSSIDGESWAAYISEGVGLAMPTVEQQSAEDPEAAWLAAEAQEMQPHEEGAGDVQTELVEDLAAEMEAVRQRNLLREQEAAAASSAAAERDFADAEGTAGILSEAMAELADLEAGLDIDQLQQFASNAGVVVSNAELRRMFAELDTNGDGVISEEEFSEGLLKLVGSEEASPAAEEAAPKRGPSRPSSAQARPGTAERPPSRGDAADMDWMRRQMRMARAVEEENEKVLDVEHEQARLSAATKIQAVGRGRRTRAKAARRGRITVVHDDGPRTLPSAPPAQRPSTAEDPYRRGVAYTVTVVRHSQYGLGISVDNDEHGNPYILELLNMRPGQPGAAEQAGVKVGSTILSIAGVDVRGLGTRAVGLVVGQAKAAGKPLVMELRTSPHRDAEAEAAEVRPEAEVDADADADAELEPEAEAEAEAVLEQVLESEAVFVPEPAPEPAPESAPEPAPEPVPEPVPEPAVAALAAETEPKAEPQQELDQSVQRAVLEAGENEVAIDVKPQPEETPKPEPHPVEPMDDIANWAAESLQAGPEPGPEPAASSAWVLEVQAAVGALISRPKMKAETVARPPFRFLRDTFAAIAAATGFMADLHSSDSIHQVVVLSPAKHRGGQGDSQARTVYLLAVINAVSVAAAAAKIEAAVEAAAAVQPADMLSGRAVEATARFLIGLSAVAAGARQKQKSRKSRSAQKPRQRPAGDGGSPSSDATASPASASDAGLVSSRSEALEGANRTAREAAAQIQAVQKDKEASADEIQFHVQRAKAEAEAEKLATEQKLAAEADMKMAALRAESEKEMLELKAQLEASRMLAAEIEQDKVREVKERELALQRGREELQRERATMREAAEAEKREAAEAERARKVAEDEARIAVMASAAATQKQELEAMRASFDREKAALEKEKALAARVDREMEERRAAREAAAAAETQRSAPWPGTAANTDVDDEMASAPSSSVEDVELETASVVSDSPTEATAASVIDAEEVDSPTSVATGASDGPTGYSDDEYHDDSEDESGAPEDQVSVAGDGAAYNGTGRRVDPPHTVSDDRRVAELEAEIARLREENMSAEEIRQRSVAEMNNTLQTVLQRLDQSSQDAIDQRSQAAAREHRTSEIAELRSSIDELRSGRDTSPGRPGLPVDSGSTAGSVSSGGGGGWKPVNASSKPAPLWGSDMPRGKSPEVSRPRSTTPKKQWTYKRKHGYNPEVWDRLYKQSTTSKKREAREHDPQQWANVDGELQKLPVIFAPSCVVLLRMCILVPLLILRTCRVATGPCKPTIWFLCRWRMV
jgi:hypothetical protein